MIQLYSARVCPFAQRSRALLMHLGIDYQTCEIDLDNRDPDFLKLTPTGRVPLLVDGDLKLYESSVVNEYLADKSGYAEAFDQAPGIRARERLAMVMWDTVIVPWFYRGMREPEALDTEVRSTLQRELQELLKTIHAIGKRHGNLMSFHCAPFWARMDWLRDLSPLPGIVDEWIDLKKWLDGSVAQPAVQKTLPERDATVQRYREKLAGSGA